MNIIHLKLCLVIMDEWRREDVVTEEYQKVQEGTHN